MDIDPSRPLKFEDNFSFDSNLREVAKIPTRLFERINFLELKLKDAQAVLEQVKALSEMGVLRRISGDLDQAESDLGDALTLIHEHNLPSEIFVVHGSRLAHVWQWQGRFDDSTPMFEELIAICEEDQACAHLKDFVYQHAGKNLFDQKRFGKALTYFQKALAVRMEKGQEGLLASTQYAIAVTRERLVSV